MLIFGFGIDTFLRWQYFRLWWIIMFVMCIGGCVIMVYQIFDKWKTTPVMVSLATKETPTYDIPFPAVTICPESKISTKCLNYSKILIARKLGNLRDTTYTENKYFDYMALLCRAENHLKKLQLSNRSRSEMFHERLPNGTSDLYPMDFVVPDYSDFLHDCASVNLANSKCQWMGVNMPCSEVMNPIITDEGLCYTFNMFDVRDLYSDINQMKYFAKGPKSNWDPDWGYPANEADNSYPRRSFLNGAKNAFVAVFFTKKNQLDYACRDFALQGIRVSLNMPSRIPRPSQVFFSVGLDTLTTAAVTPTLTSVTENIRDYDPHDRHCYFSTERTLRYFKVYSQGNCNMECWTNYTIQFCNCVSFYMPRDNQTRICSLQERYCLEQARVDYPQAMLSERLWARDRNQSRRDEVVFNCDCLPICSDLLYDAELAAGAWDFNNPDEAMFDEFRGVINQYYASAVKVFFKNNYFLPAQKDELYGITDVISDCGGVLGLFTGFSLFSVAEIIYFLSIRLIENYRNYGHWSGPTRQTLNE